MASLDQKLQQLQEILDSDFITQVEFEQRRAALLEEYGVSASYSSAHSSRPVLSSSGGFDPLSGELYKVHLGVKVGDFSRATKTILSLNYYNDSSRAARVRQRSGLDDPVQVQIELALNSNIDESVVNTLKESVDLISNEIRRSAKDDVPLEANKVSANYEGSERIFRASFSAHEAAAQGVLGVATMANVKSLSLRLDSDESVSAGAHFFTLDLQIPKSTLLIAKEAIGDKIPVYYYEILELFQELSLDLKFDSAQKLFNGQTELQKMIFLLPELASFDFEGSVEEVAAKLVSLYITGLARDSTRDWAQIRPVYSLITNSFASLKSVAAVAGDFVVELDIPFAIAKMPRSEDLPETIPYSGVISDEDAAALPREENLTLHEAHPLVLTNRIYLGTYVCDSCREVGSGWVYHCAECNFDVHPHCCAASRK